MRSPVVIQVSGVETTTLRDPSLDFTRASREYSRAKRVDIHHLTRNTYYVSHLSTGV